MIDPLPLAILKGNKAILKTTSDVVKREKEQYKVVRQLS